MAFPQVEDTVTRIFLTASTSHAVVMPATVNAGDLLLMTVSAHASGADGIDTPTGWSIVSSYILASTAGQIVYGKDAVGDEGGSTVTVTMTNSSSVVAIVQRISGWGGTLGTDVEATTPVGPTSTSAPDPPSITATWGADDNLFIGITTGMNDDTVYSAFPYATNQADGSAGASAN